MKLPRQTGLQNIKGTSKNSYFIPTAVLQKKFIAYISNICCAAKFFLRLAFGQTLNFYKRPQTIIDYRNVTDYNLVMIKTFKHKRPKAFFETGNKSGIQPHHAPRLARQLIRLDIAKNANAMNMLVLLQLDILGYS